MNDWLFGFYQNMTHDERKKLGLPATVGEYDADAAMLTAILQEYFANIVIRILHFDEMRPMFEGTCPWFYRVKISLFGLQFYYDMPFQQWYETKDTKLFVHIVYGGIRDRLMAHITQQDVNKWRFV